MTEIATYMGYFAAVLLGSGVYMLLARRNLILILIGIELILNAANLNIIRTAYVSADASAEVAVVIAIVIAAAEAAVGLAVIRRIYRVFGTVNLDEINQLREK